jgi:hypothetical protein
LLKTQNKLLHEKKWSFKLLFLLTTTPKSLSSHKHRKILLLEIQKIHEFVRTSMGVGRKSLMKLITSNHVVFGQSIKHD